LQSWYLSTSLTAIPSSGNLGFFHLSTGKVPTTTATTTTTIAAVASFRKFVGDKQVKKIQVEVQPTLKLPLRSAKETPNAIEIDYLE
jgi:hypothetical protein